MREYLIPIPYTFTILTLIIINVVALYVNRKSINWKKYLSVQVFTFLFGMGQIHGLENLGNVPAWSFPKGSSLGIYVYKNILLEDVLFVPCCSSLFYYFMFKIRNVPDLIKNKSLICWPLALSIVIEAMIYQAGGEGCSVLMVAYTLMPIVVLLVIGFNFRRVNITHALLTLCFCLFINCGWDFINAYLMHWVYDVNCNLFGKHGWFLSNKLHVSIFVQFPISGFTVMYFSNIYFEGLYGSKRIR